MKPPANGRDLNSNTSDILVEKPTAETLIEDLNSLANDLSSAARKEEIQETKAYIAAANARGLIESNVRSLDANDAAEAFIGSVIFASPLLVEDGVFDIAAHLFRSTVAGIPIYLIANLIFVGIMTYALLEWTGRDKTETHHLLGVIPTRVVMILGVSFVVATILMTVWGRLGDWNPPTEALARIGVLWTVGALGAALGDVISENDSPERLIGGEDRLVSEKQMDQLSDAELLSSIQNQFVELETSIESDFRRHEVQQLRVRTQKATVSNQLGVDIRKYTSRDIAEAFVGSIFFSIPFLVEDGVFDVADYFLSFRIGQFPVFFLLNAGFVFVMVAILLYWAGPQRVQVSRPLWGVIPRRLVGVTLVSFLTAAALMTMWGRLDAWQDPVVAIARISVAWAVASFGAALGDILPGESSGEDINDELAGLSELINPTDEQLDD